MSENNNEKTEHPQLHEVLGFVPIQTAFAIACWVDDEIEIQKRSTAIAFLNAVSEDGCDNYFRKGDEWFLGDPEEEEDAEGPFTAEQVYDAYLQSLPK